MGDAVERPQHVVPDVVRRPPRQQVEHRGAQRPHVGGLAALSAGGDLGCQVGGRPGEHAGLGQRRIGLDPGDPEVGQLGPATRADQDVGRLHVAVDDAGRVSGHEGVRDLTEQPRRVVRGQPSFVPDDLGQRRTLDVLHHQPVDVGVAVDRDVEDRDHVRVVEVGTQACLTLGACEVGPVGAREQADALERHLAAEDLVPTEPDRTHAASPDLALERVAACDHGWPAVWGPTTARVSGRV